MLPPFFILALVAVLAAQFSELNTANEILSLSSFITLISFSALAFNWSRVSTTFTPEPFLKEVYQTGIDLFLASLLALVATFFAWLQAKTIPLPQVLQPVLFALHWLFLACSLLLFVISILHLAATARQILDSKE